MIGCDWWRLVMTVDDGDDGDEEAHSDLVLNAYGVGVCCIWWFYPQVGWMYTYCMYESSLSLSIYIYIYIHIVYVYIYIYTNILYIYIYIYIYLPIYRILCIYIYIYIYIRIRDMIVWILDNCWTIGLILIFTQHLWARTMGSGWRSSEY